MQKLKSIFSLGFAEQIETLDLDDLVRLQRQITEIICSRYTQRLAVVFTDIVDSTQHLHQLGDAGGYSLWQRHADLVRRVTADHGGTLIDTVGDGTFSYFPSCSSALLAMSALQWAIAESNKLHATEPRLCVRAAVHCGEVLCDNHRIIGKSVNLCARLLNLADVQEIIVSEEVFHELSSEVQAACHPLRPRHLKGFSGKMKMLRFAWQSTKELLYSQEKSGRSSRSSSRDDRSATVILPTPNPAGEPPTPSIH